ncbi:hypothetical protein H2787_06650 [Acinetobacter baumannii]|nr:hypothetical protein H2787_06650 [Acinetobacter baumannii]
MPTGMIINSESGEVVFDGTVKIPKILGKVLIKNGQTSAVLNLNKPLDGTMFFIPKGLATTVDPIYAPLGINYEVSLSSNKQVVTVKYIATSEQPKAGTDFEVYIGEY